MTRGGEQPLGVFVAWALSRVRGEQPYGSFVAWAPSPVRGEQPQSNAHVRGSDVYRWTGVAQCSTGEDAHATADS
ncbi:MAG: hypothetical protein KDB14_01665 [Planctomycetales bacterium]|nr:hypothetical protein [Planctomycetales bacterium]